MTHALIKKTMKLPANEIKLEKEIPKRLYREVTLWMEKK